MIQHKPESHRERPRDTMNRTTIALECKADV